MDRGFLFPLENGQILHPACQELSVIRLLPIDSIQPDESKDRHSDWPGDSDEIPSICGPCLFV